MALKHVLLRVDVLHYSSVSYHSADALKIVSYLGMFIKFVRKNARREITVLYTAIFRFLDSKWEGNKF